MTRELGSRLTAEDLSHVALQVGAQFDIPEVLQGRARCVSYHDGSLAEAIRSPYWAGELNAREVDRALAYERKVYHGVDRIFTMSEYLRRSFIENFEVPAEKVYNVGGAINLEAIPGPAFGKSYDGSEILFIGVQFERKGGPQLLEAFRAVRSQIPRAILHIVGPRGLTIPPGREAGVEFHGYLSKSDPVDRARLEALFQRCSLFVMPSLYEPFGVAPLEAMAHQIPCVVTGRWALPEIVRPGVTGELVEAGRVDELQSKICTLLSDPDALRRMGEAGRNRVLEAYTWEHVVRRIGQALPG